MLELTETCIVYRKNAPLQCWGLKTDTLLQRGQKHTVRQMEKIIAGVTEWSRNKRKLFKNVRSAKRAGVVREKSLNLVRKCLIWLLSTTLGNDNFKRNRERWYLLNTSVTIFFLKSEETVHYVVGIHFVLFKYMSAWKLSMNPVCCIIDLQ